MSAPLRILTTTTTTVSDTGRAETTTVSASVTLMVDGKPDADGFVPRVLTDEDAVRLARKLLELPCVRTALHLGEG